MTDREKELVTKLNHPLYTAEFLEEWINRNENILANPLSALQAMGAKGFYEAVKYLTELETVNRKSERRDILKECESCYWYVFGSDKEHCDKCAESVNENGVDGFEGFWKPIYAKDN